MPLPRLARIVGILLLPLVLPIGMAAATTPARIIGYVDGLSSAGTGGWACVPDSSATVSLRIFAGTNLIGVYPETVSRPDVRLICGSTSSLHGFGMAFDPGMIAQIAGQPSLRIDAISVGLAPVTLATSTPQAQNPLELPIGMLTGIDSSGAVLGLVSAPGITAPAIRILAGAPLGQGGQDWGSGNAISDAPGSYHFVIPASGAASTGNFSVNIPLYGYANDPAGAWLPLAGPLALTTTLQQAQVVPLKHMVVQSGTNSGIRNTIYTSWIPSGYAFGALSGDVTLSGNAASLYEALVIVGVSNDNQQSCAQRNGTMPAYMPQITTLWNAILKNNVPQPVSVSINFALPYGVRVNYGAQGSCLMTIVSAGYVFLDADSAKYSTISLALAPAFNPVAPLAPAAIAVPIGGEFKHATGAPQNLTTYQGIRVSRRTQLDGIAGSVSASPVTGAPANTGWQPAPTGPWTMDTSLIYMPSAICAGSGLVFKASANSTLSSTRNGTPTPFIIPAGSLIVMRLPLDSAGSTPEQHTAFKGFGNFPPGGSTELVLNPGDCLVAFHHVISAASNLQGYLDFENQSILFLRDDP